MARFLWGTAYSRWYSFRGSVAVPQARNAPRKKGARQLSSSRAPRLMRRLASRPVWPKASSSRRRPDSSGRATR